jgi:hypothetical protein
VSPEFVKIHANAQENAIGQNFMAF